MKSIIENSIKVNIRGYGSAIKTLFNITKEEDKKLQKYVDLSVTSSRKIWVTYGYTENGESKFNSLELSIPAGLNETGVKDYIIEQINKQIES